MMHHHRVYHHIRVYNKLMRYEGNLENFFSFSASLLKRGPKEKDEHHTPHPYSTTLSHNIPLFIITIQRYYCLFRWTSSHKEYRFKLCNFSKIEKQNGSRERIDAISGTIRILKYRSITSTSSLQQISKIR